MPDSDIVRVFFDADVLIAGSASSTGASHVLLRLSEARAIRGITCEQALREAERNLAAKLPAALPIFRAILDVAKIDVMPDSSPGHSLPHLAGVHPDDRPILIAALNSRCDFLVTFNVRHYRGVAASIAIARPGELLGQIRRKLAGLA